MTCLGNIINDTDCTQLDSHLQQPLELLTCGSTF